MTAVRTLAIVILCLTFVGCSSEPPKLTDGLKVSGKVLLPNGSPLAGGTLILRPENGLFGATGQIQSDGTFKLENAGKENIAPGQYQVFVRFSDPSEARLKPTVSQRYQQTGDEGDSDVVVDIQNPADDLVIRLKR